MRFVKTGRLVRYRKKDIREWLESHTAFQSTIQAQQEQDKLYYVSKEKPL